MIRWAAVTLVNCFVAKLLYEVVQTIIIATTQTFMRDHNNIDCEQRETFNGRRVSNIEDEMEVQR